NMKTKNDAAIGIVFTAMFSIGVIGISSISRTGVHLDLKDFLFGNVLGVSNEDLIMTGVVMMMVIMSIIIFYRNLFASTFQPTIASTMGIPVKLMHYYLMLLLSFAVVAAMQTVGVILVVAMLITPASTALLLTNKLRRVLLVASIIGFLSSLMGLFISIIYEMPPGPAIAVTATAIYLIAALASPEHGVIAKWVRKSRQQRKVVLEDILKEVFKMSFSAQSDIDKIAEKLHMSRIRINRMISILASQKLITKENGGINLTDSGKTQANTLIRAHRLWESYLVKEMGMDISQIHPEAERLEHMLTDDEVDAVDRQLGFPALDPHGSPIPTREKSPLLALTGLAVTDKAIISQRQPGADITYRLWQLGLGPDEAFEVRTLGNPITIQVNEEVIAVPGDLAPYVSVEKISE
ncbi:MAG: metal ABC transporter permease, partial [Bacteroidota bacterium]|nr:metal ABC transporter permease [Bacteroidota bacterium]